MLRNAWTGRVVAGLAAFSMLSSPALAAAKVDVRSVDPLVAMALMSSAQSREALCATRGASAATDPALVTAAANGAVDANGQPVVRGCVLPVTDPAPVAAPQQGVVSTLEPNYSFGLPVLLLAAGVALLAALTSFGDDDDNGPAISPA